MEKNNLSAAQRNTNKVKVAQQGNFILQKSMWHDQNLAVSIQDRKFV